MCSHHHADGNRFPVCYRIAAALFYSVSESMSKAELSGAICSSHIQACFYRKTAFDDLFSGARYFEHSKSSVSNNTVLDHLSAYPENIIRKR